MPPKAVSTKILTRSQSRDSSLEFQWSRQLGGSVEVSSRELDRRSEDSQSGDLDTPVDDEVDSVSVEVEVEVQDSSSEESE